MRLRTQRLRIQEHSRALGAGALPESDYADAAEAVKVEYRATSRTIKLCALQVEPAGTPEDALFSIDVSRFGEFDWTWEGARALRPATADPPYAWSGEIVEVDEVACRLFVKTDGPRPCIGDFLVTPFDFLAGLQSIFNGPSSHAARALMQLSLAGAIGQLEPRPYPECPTLPQLKTVWKSSWGYLWGPPGTGKTYTVGRQVAEALQDPSERLLVLSTTNKATDEVAISIGKAICAKSGGVNKHLLCRIGSGADEPRFRAEGLEDILPAGDPVLRQRLAALRREHEGTRDVGQRARLWAQIQQIRQMLSVGRQSIAEVESRVIVTTVFMALRDLASTSTLPSLQSDTSTFTTVIVDEAGLISRAATAALSLWAARRFVLVGDPRQLSPISKISRVLPSNQAKWLASSGLSHVRPGMGAMVLLDVQHRMHPDIRRVVSEYQYGGMLRDASSVTDRPAPFHPRLPASPRAVWYVLDEDTEDLAHIRAERGPGNKSWVRPRSSDIVERLLKVEPSLALASGMFVTPFVAQARRMAALFRRWGLGPWAASTTHRQQGAEADVVLFDTVNASSTAWSHGEWQRLLNVGMSRARHLLIVLASRAEMQEPYMSPLIPLLAPRALRGTGGQLRWVVANVATIRTELGPDTDHVPASALGPQLRTRKAMRPILSAEQERLCAYPLDGKPRLVRGVAGSGKTAVLAHWLTRRLADAGQDGPYWVVYANAALRALLNDAITDAWARLGVRGPLPWSQVELFHIVGLLDMLEQQAGLPPATGDAVWEFEGRSEQILRTAPLPRCKALFVDEAQDMGAKTLELLTQLVQRSDADDSKAGSVNVFYDDAQNVYGRRRPVWSELGIDMRGRSTIMKESFRSTRPITEFALNTLYRLQPPDENPDHKELLAQNLLEAETRNGRRWWRVRYNQVEGPRPDFRKFPDRDSELAALYERVINWIDGEGVNPRDIRIIANDRYVRQLIATNLGGPGRRRLAVEQKQQGQFTNREESVVVTTPHSIKGHEAEIVVVPCADKFVAKNEPGTRRHLLPSVLYAAMTRARSVLYVSAIERSEGSPSALVVDALQSSLEDLLSVPRETALCSSTDGHLDLLARIDPAHQSWLERLADGSQLEVAPICRADGSIVAEPLFCVRSGLFAYACFTNEPSSYVTNELEDLGFRVIRPGDHVI